MEPLPASWAERVGLGIVLTMLALSLGTVVDAAVGHPLARHLLGLFL